MPTAPRNTGGFYPIRRLPLSDGRVTEGVLQRWSTPWWKRDTPTTTIYTQH